MVVNSGIDRRSPGILFTILLHRCPLIICFVCIKYFIITNHPKARQRSLLKPQAHRLWRASQVPPGMAAGPPAPALRWLLMACTSRGFHPACSGQRLEVTFCQHAEALVLCPFWIPIGPFSLNH